MAQTGFTPIQLYSSSTATNVPLAANLANGELAINITDGKLFYKDNAAAVQVIGWKTVPATAGGTGQTSYAVGDLIYADTTTTLAKLADVATGNALISGGVGVAPSWGKIGLTTHVSGTLPVANGGTNLTTFTANGLVYASSTSALATTSTLIFDSSGNLGIGQTSIPSFTRLAVTGTAGAQTDAKQQIFISAPTTTAGEGAGIRINAASGAKEAVGIVGVVNNASGNLGSMTFGVYNGGANIPEWMRISNAGIVTMSAYGAGTATFSAAGVISSVSDETWKIKDGVPVDPDAMLNKLSPGYWYYNEEKAPAFGADRQLGFYAQNVNSAIGPEAAPTPEEGKPWGYYDRSVLAITVMSLQKALATIELLNARITKLEGT